MQALDTHRPLLDHYRRFFGGNFSIHRCSIAEQWRLPEIFQIAHFQPSAGRSSDEGEDQGRSGDAGGEDDGGREGRRLHAFATLGLAEAAHPRLELFLLASRFDVGLIELLTETSLAHAAQILPESEPFEAPDGRATGDAARIGPEAEGPSGGNSPADLGRAQRPSGDSDTGPIRRTPAMRLGVGHTVDFRRPWLDASACSRGLISLPYPFGPGMENGPQNASGETCRVLWLLPITPQEDRFKRQHGLEALEDRFVERRIDTADPDRPSAV